MRSSFRGNATAMVEIARKETDMNLEEVRRQSARSDAFQGSHRLHDGDPEQMKTHLSRLPYVLSSIVSILAQPHMENARMETRAVSGGLESVPMRGILGCTVHASLDWLLRAHRLRRPSNVLLEQQRHVRLLPRAAQWRSELSPVSNNQTVKLEGPQGIGGAVPCGRATRSDKIRTFTPECNLDAGGLPFIWLTGVTPSDSIHLLLAMAKDATGGSREEHA
jgi:hypothetical protein